jgi:probable rRNA maturation factor
VTVHVLSDHPRGRAAAPRLKRRAEAFLAALGKEGSELSLLVVGDRGIRRLNREWRGKDVATDVLSFPSAPEGAGALLGDVVVSLDTAARVARAERRPVAEELDRYVVHGILHLLGMDHETPREARVMAAREDELLTGHGLVTRARASRDLEERSPRPVRSSAERAGGERGAKPPDVRRRSRSRPR